MFSTDADPTFTAEVHISRPGKSKAETIEVEFHHHTTDQLKALGEEMQEGKVTDLDALTRIIVRWKGVDKDYSPEVLAQVLQKFPSASSAFWNGFRKELVEAKAKN